jgi:hypothetical protein
VKKYKIIALQKMPVLKFYRAIKEILEEKAHLIPLRRKK